MNAQVLAWMDDAIEILVDDGIHHGIHERENMELYDLRTGREAVARMIAALHECETYLAEREDVNDGDYGVPEPNTEMTLLREVRAALAKAGAK